MPLAGMAGLGQRLVGSLGGAVDSLGLGDMLRNEVTDETEELRKKRMQEQQNRGLMGPTGGALSPMMLFGGGLPGGYGS